MNINKQDRVLLLLPSSRFSVFGDFLEVFCRLLRWSLFRSLLKGGLHKSTGRPLRPGVYGLPLSTSSHEKSKRRVLLQTKIELVISGHSTVHWDHLYAFKIKFWFL